MTIEALLTSIVQSFADRPDEVHVASVTRQDGSTIFQISAAPEDVGKAVGKGGTMAQAMRTLIGCIGVKEGRHYKLEVLQPEAVVRTAATGRLRERS